MNKAIICGHLGRDPEVRTTKGGTNICSLNVATSRKYKNAGGEFVEETCWHRVSVWGKQGESCAQYLAKGRQVLIEGRIHNSSYTDGDGVKKYTSEIVADRVQFLGGRGEGGGAGGGGGTEPPAPYNPGEFSSPPPGPGDDDIPFIRYEGV